MSTTRVVEKWVDEAAALTKPSNVLPRRALHRERRQDPHVHHRGGHREQVEGGPLLPDVVLNVERGGCVVRYDGPKWNDVWVRAERVRAPRLRWLSCRRHGSAVG